jgi:hypothetical protein
MTFVNQIVPPRKRPVPRLTHAMRTMEPNSSRAIVLPDGHTCEALRQYGRVHGWVTSHQKQADGTFYFWRIA